MVQVLSHAFFNPGRGAMREHFVVERIRRLLDKRIRTMPPMPGHVATAAEPRAERTVGKIMVSYCWADTTFVLDQLALSLAPIASTLWLDRLGGDQGMGDWAKASMDRGVKNADVMIAVVSPAYVKSINCGFELAKANEHNKFVLPVKFGVPFSEWPPKRVGKTEMQDQVRRFPLFLSFPASPRGFLAEGSLALSGFERGRCRKSLWLTGSPSLLGHC